MGDPLPLQLPRGAVVFDPEPRLLVNLDILRARHKVYVIWCNPAWPELVGVIVAFEPGGYDRVVRHFPGGIYTYASGVRWRRCADFDEGLTFYELARRRYGAPANRCIAFYSTA